MRIAMVTPRYRPLLGGVETHVFEVARRMAERAEVTVLTTDPSGGLPPVEEHHGVRILRFDALPRRRDYYVAPALLRAIERPGFDLVHVQGAHTLLAPLALNASRRARVPSLVTFHTGGSSSRWRAMARDLQWRAEGSLLRSVEARVAVCQYEVGYFSDVLGLEPARFRLIRNGAEPLPVGTLRSAFAGDPLICSIGRLERYKGHHRAIAAMSHLCAAAPGAHLVVVGSGPFEGALRRLVAERGLERAVSFQSFGSEERAELGALVAASDLVVLLSDYEAHPVSIMEALALGTDVLVSDTTGLSELGAAGLARLVSPHASPAQTATAMGDAARARTWRLGPPNLPSWDDCADGLLASYEEVLACAS